RGEMAREVERKGGAFVCSLVGNCGCGWAAVADLEVECLADRLAVRIGRRHRARVVAVRAVSRYPGDDARMSIVAETGRHCPREGERVAGSGCREVAGNV